MTIQELDKRIKRAIQKYRAKKRRLAVKYYASAKEKGMRRYYKRLAREQVLLSKVGMPFDLKLLKRTRYFKNSKGSCGLDLIQETGHSYHWWQMFAKINGHYVLNTYNYSKCTARHINCTYSVLKDLGIRFLEVAAPQGLQNLEIAKHHAIEFHGRIAVEQKYARKQNKWARERMNNAENAIKTLAKIGVKITQGELLRGYFKALDERADRLKRAKEARVQLIIKKVCDAANVQYQGAPIDLDQVA